MRLRVLTSSVPGFLIAVAIALSPATSPAATFESPFSMPSPSRPGGGFDSAIAGKGLTPEQRKDLMAVARAFDASNFAVSEMLAKRLLDVVPEQPDVWYLLGLTLANVGRMDEALDALDKSAGYYDQNAAPIVLKGDILKSQGKIKEATQAYVSALKRDPSNWLAYESLAVIQEERGDTESAIEYFQKAVSKSSGDRLFPRYRLAELYLKSGRASEAVDVLLDYVQVMPEDAVALAALAQSQVAAGTPADAVGNYKKAIRGAPNAPMLVLQLAAAQQMSGAVDDALETLSDGRDRFPEIALMHQNLGSLLGATGQYGDATKALERGKERFPDDVRITRLLSTAYARTGRLTDAIALASELVKQEGPTGDNQLWLGMLHEQAQQYPNAQKAYEAALKAAPENWIAANNLAALITENDAKRAIELAKGAVEMSDGLPAVKDTLAWAYVSDGQPEKAAALYAELAELDPESAVTAYRYGRALVDAGETAQGRASLQRALELDTEFEGAQAARGLLAKTE